MTDAVDSRFIPPLRNLRVFLSPGLTLPHIQGGSAHQRGTLQPFGQSSGGRVMDGIVHRDPHSFIVYAWLAVMALSIV